MKVLSRLALLIVACLFSQSAWSADSASKVDIKILIRTMNRMDYDGSKNELLKKYNVRFANIGQVVKILECFDEDKAKIIALRNFKFTSLSPMQIEKILECFDKDKSKHEVFKDIRKSLDKSSINQIKNQFEAILNTFDEDATKSTVMDIILS